MTLLGIISPVEETPYIVYSITALVGAVIGYTAGSSNPFRWIKLLSKASDSFESERAKVMQEQDLYDENCARNKAAREAKEKAEKERTAREKARRERERQERKRRQREEQNSHSYQQNNQNRTSGNGSSSTGRSSNRGDYTGAWNNTASSYFKDCKNKAELKRRYHQLCKKLHPDNPEGNAELFRSMQSEYESLRRKMAG